MSGAAHVLGRCCHIEPWPEFDPETGEPNEIDADGWLVLPSGARVGPTVVCSDPPTTPDGSATETALAERSRGR